jgi:hypothetical protein
MSNFLQQAFNQLAGAEFEEIPVGIDEFIHSEDFAGIEQMSEHQIELVSRMSQIYKKETLLALYNDEAAAERRWRQTTREIIMQLGKGSGKDFTSTVAVSYVVYLLLCLKDPAKYYGKPKGNSIDIINIAINSDQANRVFFKNFVQVIRNNPWFENRYEEKQGSIEFDKNITVYSGHSEREAFEGYNTLMVILDEISGFALESASGNQNAKTAPAIYDMYKASVTSRFAEFGKLVLLSFPRFEDDFIQQKYKDAVYGERDKTTGIRPMLGEMETIIRKETLKIDPELPDGTEGNEFDIEWEEDHIIRYAYPYTFALRRPSWEVNPTKDLQKDYALDFYRNMGDALGRFACMPSNLENGFFKRIDKIEQAFSRINGVDENGIFHPQLQPDPDKTYFIHVDLAQKHDHCAVAMGHIDKWIEYQVGSSQLKEYLPLVVIDAIRWWTPTKDKSVDFKDVIEYIKAIRRRGFNIKLATFDRWNSHDTMQDLERNGVTTDQLSVDKKHYDDFLITMYDDRLLGPKEDLLIKELSELRQVVKGQKVIIDHPRKGSKDLSDAVCGAIWNSVAHTPKDENLEADALTLRDLKKQIRESDGEEEAKRRDFEERNVTVVPKPKLSEAPKDVQDMVANLLRIV